MGRILTNREVYNYFNGYSLVESHKLGGVIGEICLFLDFPGDLAEPDSKVPMVNSPNI